MAVRSSTTDHEVWYRHDSAEYESVRFSGGYTEQEAREEAQRRNDKDAAVGGNFRTWFVVKVTTTYEEVTA